MITWVVSGLPFLWKTWTSHGIQIWKLGRSRGTSLVKKICTFPTIIDAIILPTWDRSEKRSLWEEVKFCPIFQCGKTAWKSCGICSVEIGEMATCCIYVDQREWPSLLPSGLQWLSTILRLLSCLWCPWAYFCLSIIYRCS